MLRNVTHCHQPSVKLASPSLIRYTEIIAVSIDYISIHCTSRALLHDSYLIYLYIHTYIHACLHTYIHTYIYIYIKFGRVCLAITLI